MTIHPVAVSRLLLLLKPTRANALFVRNPAAMRHPRFSVAALRAASSNVTVKVPHMADSITEGTLKSLSKALGEFVHADDELASIETDKVDVPVNSPISGTVVKYFAKIEDTVLVGADLCEIETKEQADASSSTAKQTVSSEAKPKTTAAAVPTGSVKTPVAQGGVAGASASPKDTVASVYPVAGRAVQPSKAPTVAGGDGERRERMSAMRMRIGERLKESQNTAAALTTFNEVDMSAISAFRVRARDQALKEHGVKLGFMSAFVKAVCYAYRHVPIVMARIEGNEVVHPASVDIAVAVATPKGLVTPVLRNCQEMSFLDVEHEIGNMSSKARAGKITLGDLAGGSFTISNGGVFGSLFGTPIINAPQSAILGMHATVPRPVVVDGAVVVRPMMYVCLTYDHRLIDGREAVTFLVKLKEAIEDPVRMLL